MLLLLFVGRSQSYPVDPERLRALSWSAWHRPMYTGC
jgi:hypothetical protein